LRFGSLANRLRIREILRPPCGQFRRNEVGRGDEKRVEAALRIDYAFNAPLPGRLKIYAGNLGKNIEAVRIVSKTKETTRLSKFFRPNALKRRAEGGERGVDCLRVSGVRLDKRSMSLVKRG
jgi:hypothetical protein